MFYDVRAGKYLESSINSARTVVLKASRGYVVSRDVRIYAEERILNLDIFRFAVSRGRCGWIAACKICAGYLYALL